MQPTLQTTGEIIRQWRTLPEKNELIRNIYYDADVLEAAHRYANSSEFRAIVDIARQHRIQSGYVLDVGGGNGVASLAWYFKGYKAFLAEPDSSDIVGLGALLTVDPKKHDVKPIASFGEALPFADDTFDIVFGRQVLHHMKNLKGACTEIRRVLKPSGICIISRGHVISNSEDLDIFLSNHALHKYTGSEHAYLLKEYVEAFRAGGFTSVLSLGPIESIINYFPLTVEDHTREIAGYLSKFTRRRLARRLARFSFVKRFIGKVLSDRLDNPGRLYSFVAKGRK